MHGRALHEPGRRILVVDDDPEVRMLVARSLERHGYLVRPTADLAGARAGIADGGADVIVLDIELGADSGLDLLRELRGAGREVPVLLLTGRASEGDRVLGFELGADDYLVKPFFARELTARVGALLRRRAPPEPALHAGRLRVEPAAGQAFVDGRALTLTPRELDLLGALMSAPGQVRSREQLLRDVWDSSPAWQTPATVTEHVRRLRVKLGQAGLNPDVVATVRGRGYRFDSAQAS